MQCENCGAPMRLDQERGCLYCVYCGTVHAPEDLQDGGVLPLGETDKSACPLCHVPLARALVARERILFCETCRGMLIGMGVFADIVERLQSARLTQLTEIAPPLDSRELDRRIDCPACGQAMDSHVYLGPGHVAIDTCEACSLNWLDGGALMRIVRAPDRHFAVEEVPTPGEGEEAPGKQERSRSLLDRIGNVTFGFE